MFELTLADWLEQVEGAASKANPILEWGVGDAWKYRRSAFQRMLSVLLENRGDRLHIAKEMYEDIFSREGERTKNLEQAATPPVSEAARNARDAIQSQFL